MSFNDPFQLPLPRFPESYERTRIPPQQPPPPGTSSPRPSTPPTPYWPLFSTPPIELTSLPPHHRWRTRSPSLGPPPATPPTPHDPRLDTHSTTPPQPPRPRPQARRRRRRPQARPQAPPDSAPSTANIIDPMSMIYNPPSPDFEAFDSRYRDRITLPPPDPCPISDRYYRTVAASLADLHKQVREKTAVAAFRMFDHAVRREGKMIKRALGGNRRMIMRRCHDNCAQATFERDERRVMQGLGRIWRKAVDDEIKLEDLRGRNRRRHWNAVSAMIGQKTLGWRMRIRRLKAKGKRDARKLRPIRKAGAGLGRTEARRQGSLARGGDSGYESDDSWTDSSSGEWEGEQGEEQVDDEECEDTTLGWAETYRLL